MITIKDLANNIRYYTGNRLIPIIFAFLLSETICIGQNNSIDWLKTAGGKGSDYINAMTIDKSKNIYLCGFIEFAENNSGYGTMYDAIFNQITIEPTPSGVSQFIAKYDSLGIIQWVKTPKKASSCLFHDIVCDSTGNVYVVGEFHEEMILDTVVLQSSKYFDAFIAKLDSSGKVKWVIQGKSYNARATSIKFDNDNNLIVSGNTTDTLYLGKHRIPGGEFISKIDIDGNIIWTSGIHQNNYNTTLAVYNQNLSIDKNGNIYSIGRYTGELSSKDTTLSCQDRYELYVSKYSKEGNLIWIKNFQDPYFATQLSTGRSIITYPNNDIGILGEFTGDATIGSTYMHGASTGLNSPFIARLTPDGDIKWANNLKGTIIHDMTTQNDSTYVTGYIDETLSLDSITIKTTGSRDIFLAQIGPTGELSWACAFGGSGNQSGDVLVTNNKDIYLGAEFRCNASIKDYNLSTYGEYSCYYDKSDFLIMKLNKYAFMKNLNGTTDINANPNNKQTNITIYPNPSTNRICVELNNLYFGEATIRILNIEGKTIIKESLYKNSCNYSKIMDIANLKSGLYIVVVNLVNEILSQKITIQSAWQ